MYKVTISPPPTSLILLNW